MNCCPNIPGRLLLMVAALLLCCAGCGKDYSHSEATAEVAPEKMTDRTDWASEVTDPGEVRDGWIKNFNDPVLDKLVQEAMSNNPNLQASSARVDRARALATQAGAALQPSVGLGGRLAGTSESSTAEGIGVGISWELDVWGRIHQGVRSAEESAEAVRADYEFARQSLAASTAKAWFLACETTMMLDYLNTVVDLLEQMSDIVKTKNTVGQVSELDVHQINARLASAQDAVAKAEIAKKEAARSLETLLGRYPAAEIKGADDLDALPGPVPAGMPSAILERRPDLISAEDKVAAAFYKTKGAELLHLPSFTLSAGGGLSLGQAIAGLAGGMFAPLYTGGEIEGEIAQATAEQKEAVAGYATAALQAFKEVETGLTNEQLLAERVRLLSETAEENKKAYELSEIQYKVGKTDLFQTLELQAKWVGSRITLLDVRREQLDNRVQLHLALGGSFEETH